MYIVDVCLVVIFLEVVGIFFIIISCFFISIFIVVLISNLVNIVGCVVFWKEGNIFLKLDVCVCYSKFWMKNVYNFIEVNFDYCIFIWK